MWYRSLAALMFTVLPLLAHAQDMVLPAQLQQAIFAKMMQNIEPGAGPSTTSPASASNLLGGISNLSPSQQNAIASHAQVILNRNLTVTEKNKLTEFQNSPEGQAIIAKLPKIAEELAPLLMQAYLGQPITPAAGADIPLPTAPAAKATTSNLAPAHQPLPLTPAGN